MTTRTRGRGVRRARAGSARRRSRRLRRVALLIVSVLAFVGLGGTVATAGLAVYFAGDLPDWSQLQAQNLAQTTRIYDRNGSLIEQLYHYNRTVVPISKISPLLRQATISVEDRTFYTNPGVDYRRLLIAAVYDLTHHSAALGASTITQQVIKNNVLLTSKKTFSRKLQELFLAEEMERRFTKDQILEIYLNTIFYGHSAFGIESASQTYFGVHAAELDLAQASFLAGLPQSPSNYDPLGTPDQAAAAKARWGQVLDAMVATHSITPAQRAKAASEDIFSRIRAAHQSAGGGRDPVTAHFVDYVISNLEQTYGSRAVYEGGLQVTTTLDLPTQAMADRAVKSAVAEYAYKGANTGALLAMDPNTGQILAMVGSANYADDNIDGQVNLTTVGRGPGSSFKPYTYGAALEKGLLTASTLVDDAHNVINGHTYSDWDGLREGMIPLRRALAESRNLPALWTYTKYGQYVPAFAAKLGLITGGSPSCPNCKVDPNDPTTTLGTSDLTMIQHLAAYSAFDNGGYKVQPQPILKITDSTGRVLESHVDTPAHERVISPELAYLMTDLLKGPAGLYLSFGSHPVAAKSGTTESWTGSWWMGYTPDLAVGTFMAHINKGPDCTSGFAQYATGFTPSGWLCPTNVLWGEHVGVSLWQPFVREYYANRPWPAAWQQPQGIVKCGGEIYIKGLPGQPCGPGATPTPSPSPSPQPAPSPIPSPSGGIVPEPSPSPSPSPSAKPTPTPKASP